MPTKKNRNNLLSRQQWLEKSLDTLVKKGGCALTIETLSRHLGVSRGSFYWHFKDKADFISQLIDYWIEIHTKSIAEYLDTLDVSASEKLFILAERIIIDNLTRYDMQIRAWAPRDKMALRKLKQNDQYRYQYVRSLFQELGFTGNELDMRTRTFAVFYSLESGFYQTITKEELHRQLKLRHAMLTQR